MTFRESIHKELLKDKNRNDSVISEIIKKKYPDKGFDSIRRRVGEVRREHNLTSHRSTNEYYKSIASLVKQYPDAEFYTIARKVRVRCNLSLSLDTIYRHISNFIKYNERISFFKTPRRYS